MLRQVVLDTETTGLNPKLGDRIIEIGCVEIVDRRVSPQHFQVYINPERAVDLGATRVHGMTQEDLRNQPKFAQAAPAFLDFVRGAQLFIHNADFDVEFLDMELGRAGLGRLLEHAAGVTDTLAFARELHPGKKNSLDALCERYFVDNSSRTLHGALRDARLLAECYLAMTRGQESLVMEVETPAAAAAALAALKVDVSHLVVLPALPEEEELHEKYLTAMENETEKASLWRRILRQP